MQFDSKVDYRAVEAMLLESIKLAPVELKIMWLCELVLVATYVYLKDNAINRKFKSDVVKLTYAEVRNIVARDKPYLARVYGLMCKYRHEFVHHGHIVAMEALKILLTEQRNELLLLANEYGVALTLDRSIFRITLNKQS